MKKNPNIKNQILNKSQIGNFNANIFYNWLFVNWFYFGIWDFFFGI